jgi:uncharacterized protein (UPF0276 family)
MTAPTAGVGFKAQHFAEAAASAAEGLWFEVHAENYMVDGGPRLAMLEALRAMRPLSIHGVGLSLASPELPDADHLARLGALVGRFEPFLVSEHLAWSRLGQHCVPDLLPFPRTGEALRHIARNIDLMQEVLGRQVLIENPAHYLCLEGHEWSEPEFLAELALRTGCGLLLDLTNVHVSAGNIGQPAADYLAAIPAATVGEIHLAGALPDAHLDLLIDCHGAPVNRPVWAMFEHFMKQHGPRPTLIEWDRNVPSFDVLMRDRNEAAKRMAAQFGEIENV